MYKYAIGLSIVAAMLASCSNQASTSQQSVIRPGTTSKTIESLQFKVRTTTTYHKGANKGALKTDKDAMLVSYYFADSGLKARMDMPASASPDNKARIAFLDGEKNTFKMYFKETMQPDTSINAISGAQVKAMLDRSFMFLNPKFPFKRWKLQDFSSAAKLALFDSTQKTGNKTSFTQKNTQNGVSSKMTLVFDEALGQVNTVINETVTNNIKTIATTETSFASVEGMEDTVIPYQITTVVKGNLQADAAVAPEVTFPTADEITTQDQAANVPADEEVVFRYSGPSLSGKVNLNQTEFKTVVNYDDIQVNTLDQSFFAVGE